MAAVKKVWTRSTRSVYIEIGFRDLFIDKIEEFD